MAGKLRPKPINLALQANHLKKMFPGANIRINRNCLIWQAQLTPTELSETYTVRLKYKLKDRPKVQVLKPELIVPEGRRLPHTYSGKQLCLYYPGSGDWRGDMLLSQTIVPWISEWLLHYEIWLVTGKWHGGGIHNGVKNIS